VLPLFFKALGFVGGSWKAEYPKCILAAFSWMLSRDDDAFFNSPGGGAVKSSFEAPGGSGDEGSGMDVARGTKMGVHGIPSSSSPTRQAVT
jgi:hypothetical protein